MKNAVEKLEVFLSKKNKFEDTKIRQLTPDASTREYFRINWNDKTAIACVYAESFAPEEQTYLDVTNLFLKADLPVAEIYDFDGETGVIIQEDFGDAILRDVLDKSELKVREELINEAISLVAKIQAATPLAFELNSIASRLKFDGEKLNWELNFFATHYFESLQKRPLSEKIKAELNLDFSELARELEKRAKVLCHRDFHAANLMLDGKDRLRIIDHQDARIGSISYDLVSLLLDRTTKIPDKIWLANKKLFFLEAREKVGLEKISSAEFDYEFDLMTIQRCLKAVGTFSYQAANRGKNHFIQYIEPMLEIVRQACERVEKFSNLRRIF